MTYIFCDTMVFLHYRLFSEIDFKSLVQSDSVTLIIPVQVSNEIDWHKNTNQVKRLRERAGKVSAKIASLIDRMDVESLSTKIRDGYFFAFLMHKNIDLSKYGLDSQNNDHKIIAAIINFQIEHPDDKIFFFTHDNAATITARVHNISTRKLPDELKLKDDLSEDERQIKKLEAEIAKYKNAIPNLALINKISGNNIFTYSSENFLCFKLPEMIKAFEVVCQEYPPYEEKKAPQSQTENQSLPKLLRQKNAFDIYLSRNHILGRDNLEAENDDIRRYMRDRNVFLSNYKKYLNEIDIFRKKIIIPVEMQIINTGTVPAESVDLHVHFPDGFQMFSDGELPQIPKPPSEPLLPRNAQELLAEKLRIPSFNIPDLSRISRNIPTVSSPNFTLKKTHSYEFDESFVLIKHGEHIKTNTEKLYIVFDSIDRIKNFSAEYIISGSNIPVAVSSTLNFNFNIK